MFNFIEKLAICNGVEHIVSCVHSYIATLYLTKCSRLGNCNKEIIMGA